MEPMTTLNFGASLAQQSKPFPLDGLAYKARQLVGAQRGFDTRKAIESRALVSKQRVSTTQNNKDKELMEVAQKFEAILIHQMLKAMRKTVYKSDLLNSFSLEQYESMMDEEIANEMVKHKGIGLADSLFYQLSRLEKDSNGSTPISKESSGVNQHE